MGRKIPGRKHRGVRDILEQNAQKERRLINKINAPPENPDEQVIPKSLARVIELKEKVKSGSIYKKRIVQKDLHINTKKPQLGKPIKQVPIFKQRPDENGKQFLGRVNHIVQEYLEINKFEQKYNVDVVRNPNTGQVEHVIKKEKDEIDELMKNARKPKHKKKDDNTPKLTKSQKRREKLKAKKIKKEQDREVLDFNHYKDEVKFGEVVHAPPVLTKFPKKAAEKNISTSSASNDFKFKSHNTGKRKKLSAPIQKMLEEERLIAIEAYKNRHKSNNLI